MNNRIAIWITWYTYIKQSSWNIFINQGEIPKRLIPFIHSFKNQMDKN